MPFKWIYLSALVKLDKNKLNANVGVAQELPFKEGNLQAANRYTFRSYGNTCRFETCHVATMTIVDDVKLQSHAKFRLSAVLFLLSCAATVPNISNNFGHSACISLCGLVQ